MRPSPKTRSTPGAPARGSNWIFANGPPAAQEIRERVLCKNRNRTSGSEQQVDVLLALSRVRVVQRIVMPPSAASTCPVT